MPYLPIKKRKLTNTWQTKEHNSFYSSAKWRKFREIYLKKHPLCIHCKRIDITMRATVIDHVKPIKQGGDPFDESNLQPLCMIHHNKKSGKDGHVK